MRQFIKYIARRRRGSVLVEAALLMPLLITAGLGAIDASYMLLQNHRAETQLAIAAGYMSKSPDPTMMESKAKNLAVTGQTSSGGTAMIPNWSTQDITIAYKTVENVQNNGTRLYRGEDVIRVVQIQTEIPYSGFGILKSFMHKNVTIKVSVEERLTSEVIA